MLKVDDRLAAYPANGQTVLFLTQEITIINTHHHGRARISGQGRMMSYTIVTVDDHREIGNLLAIVLRHPEIEVLAARDGVEGLTLIQRARPDVVLLDVMMPGVSGWEVYDTIRADRVLSDTPIVMITVLPEAPDRRRAFEQSTRDLYLTKPFDAVRLRRAIERMLGGIELWEPPSPDIAPLFE